MTKENNGTVIDLTEYLRLKKNLEKEGKTLSPQAQISLYERAERIKASIARIELLMKELKTGVRKEVPYVD